MKLGIIGLGTVGLGVIDILVNEKENLTKKGANIEIKYACDLNHDKLFPEKFDKSVLIKDYKVILNDSEIDSVMIK